MLSGHATLGLKDADSVAPGVRAWSHG